MSNTPNYTVRIPDEVLLLLKRDAERAGHTSKALVVRQILRKHYKLTKKVPA